ncbi:MAG TPA: glycosyl hydrolase family 28 protein [Mobilitalea sp.]|nr:glycosyl hydrolase family 28 protein [Mobilitalea sp.]
MNRVIAYPVPSGAVKKEDFQVRVREKDGIWKKIDTYMVKVDMHEVREASMAYFDFTGVAECEITCLKMQPKQVMIRPLSIGISYSISNNKILFSLTNPVNLSIEINGNRFHNLHLFAGNIESKLFDLNAENIIVMEGNLNEITNHQMEPVSKKLQEMGQGAVLYFGPGVHYMNEKFCNLPSNTRVYIDGGAVVMGSFIVINGQYVTIEGRGVIYLGHVEKSTYLRGVELDHAKHIMISGITIINPAHYSILMGSCHDVMVDNVKAFSCVGWSDGIDMMACDNILIQNVFLRNSDDCIAIYGMRGKFEGDTHNIQVSNSVLWADVAHPVNIGTHGDSENNGNIISKLLFNNIDILEHHEPQDDYLGCMTINAGDKNIVRDVTFQNIRVEQFERGKLLDLQVKHNPKYNPAPGQKIEDITFSNITYNGYGEHTSCINGFDPTRLVENVHFKKLMINGEYIKTAEQGNIEIGEFTGNIKFS